MQLVVPDNLFAIIELSGQQQGFLSHGVLGYTSLDGHFVAVSGTSWSCFLEPAAQLICSGPLQYAAVPFALDNQHAFVCTELLSPHISCMPTVQCTGSEGPQGAMGSLNIGSVVFSLSNSVLKPVAARTDLLLSLQFQESLQREVKQGQDMKGTFLEQFSQEDFDAIISGWNDKLKRVADGEQRWGLFQAVKP